MKRIQALNALALLWWLSGCGGSQAPTPLDAIALSTDAPTTDKPAARDSSDVRTPLNDADCSAGWSVFATGLTNPRHIRFGPDGLLYVAEAGVGGGLLGTCDWEGNMFNQTGPYMGGYTGRISRIWPDGTRETVADGLPGFIDGFGDALGVSDVAWIDDTLYAVIEGGGCTRGLPNDPAGIVRINADGSYTYVADITAFVRANPVASEPLCGPDGDCEPDGVPHSLLAHGNTLYVVETNHNSILRVNPVTGEVSRLYDLSVIDPAPIILIRRGKNFYLGGFRGWIQSFDHKFGDVALFDADYSAIVDMTFVANDLYILETFAPDTPWTPDTGRVIRRKPDGSRAVIACGLNFPIGMARGEDGALYVSTVSYGQGPVEGLGQIIRIAATDVPTSTPLGAAVTTASGGSSRSCWEFSANTQCQGVPYGAPCIVDGFAGTCVSYGNVKVAPGVYDCNWCKPKGRVRCGRSCR